MSAIHQSRVGTFHPAPDAEIAWMVNDTRGTIDASVACEQCGACACEICPKCKEPVCNIGITDKGYCAQHGGADVGTPECIGLPFVFVCMEGGESLCSDCAEAEGIDIAPCTCE